MVHARPPDPFAPPAAATRPVRLWYSEPQLLLLAFIVSSAGGAGLLAASAQFLPAQFAFPDLGPNVWAVAIGAVASAAVGALVPLPGAAVTMATVVGLRALHLEGRRREGSVGQDEPWALAAAASLAGLAVFMGFVLGILLITIGIAAV